MKSLIALLAFVLLATAPLSALLCATGHSLLGQIYLPNYGWLSVDTSVGQGVMYSVGVTEEERRIYKDFYFGDLDR